MQFISNTVVPSYEKVKIYDVCEKHLKPEHLLFVPHLVVQKRAGVCHPIFSSCSIPVQLRGRALVHT